MASYQPATQKPPVSRFPTFFIGHGSPMNALEKNTFTEAWGHAVAGIKPRAILVISAHWLTRGTEITAMPHPKTIHDFGGFPQALFEVEYPAPGSAEIADAIATHLGSVCTVKKNQNWGLDHGTWSVLVHMFPDASVPVLQLSIDVSAPSEDYFRIGAGLRALREKGILIIGSGNIVHNLRLVDWSRLNEQNFAHDWAHEADALTQKMIREKKWGELADFDSLPEDMQTAINSAEHYIPLLYIGGAAYPDETPVFFNDTAVGGAITMTCVRFG